MDALQKITESCMKNELPSFEVGDTVRVQVKIKRATRKDCRLLRAPLSASKKAASIPPSPFAVSLTAAA